MRGFTLVTVLTATLLLTGCAGLLEFLDTGLATTPHLMLGNPSDASATEGQPNNYLMVKPQFALSYNRDRGIPNWVSWQLNEQWLGDTERQNNFRHDPELPEDWPTITSTDYRDKRYDRGHMVPSADRTASIEDNSATFVLTNVLPQASGNNRGPWNDLERYCRRLVRDGNELYIMAGHIGQKDTIGRARLTVASSVWKVIVVMPQPGLRPADVSAATRVIAVNLPNVSGIRDEPWQDFLTTVDDIEELTGLDLLSRVNAGVQQVIEGQVDLQASTFSQR